MTFEEWRNTRKWHDILPPNMRSDQDLPRPGFSYKDGAWIELVVHEWYTEVFNESCSYANLKDTEYFLWSNFVAPTSDTQFDECTITWNKKIYYSCTAALPRGLDDEAAFEAMQELLINDGDVEKEVLSIGQPTLGTVYWE